MSASQTRRAVVPRDQEKSTFASILDRLVNATPGAIAAVLVDAEGEAVDYAGRMDAYELKVIGAHWPIVLHEIDGTRALGAIHQITLRAKARSYHVRCVHPGYAVVIVLHRHAAFTLSDRALRQLDAELATEAGWPHPRDDTRWYFVRVDTEREDRTRPRILHTSSASLAIEVLGCMVGLRAGEKGFRVRLPNGHEMTLVRERLGRWFADERV